MEKPKIPFDLPIEIHTHYDNPSEEMVEAMWEITQVYDLADRPTLLMLARAVLSCGRPEGWVAVKREDLKSIEFTKSVRDGDLVCAVCNAFDNTLHAPDCWLGLALKGGE